MYPDEQDQNASKRGTLAGGDLLDYIKRVIRAGNLHRLVVCRADGGVLVRVPLTIGIAVVGALILLAPLLAAIGAIAALVAKLQVDIVRRNNLD